MLPEIYVLFPEQFQHFVAEGQFTNPVFLAGLSSHIFRDGEVSEAKVYVNANGQELFRNVAHELTHPATPGVPTWLSEGVAEYIASRVQMGTDPDQARFRFLDSRGRVRRALQRGDLMDLQELQDFPLERGGAASRAGAGLCGKLAACGIHGKSYVYPGLGPFDGKSQRR